ncbi:MAG: hydrogenase maturation nickel metallochaperone HypA [Candidatus Atribacteria bacterium]|nr:hydrogenase maturation nickel metallochaperone HypA [Candidatus Atribacteria bacterium]
MHERSVAKNLLDIVLHNANKDGKKYKIKTINIVIGQFTVINEDLLVDSFYQLSQSTSAENAIINITHSPLEGRCQDCQSKFEINKNEFQCPFCNSHDIQIVSGDELFVQDIEVLYY